MYQSRPGDPMSPLLTSSSKLPPVASVSTIRRQLAPTVGHQLTSGVMFLAESLPPITKDISFMIGSYGIISRYWLALAHALPTRVGVMPDRALVQSDAKDTPLWKQHRDGQR